MRLISHFDLFYMPIRSNARRRITRSTINLHFAIVFSASRCPAGRDSMSGMRRWLGSIGRWTLNILAGLSLLIFVATVVLWVRSYWRGDYLVRGSWRYEADDWTYTYIDAGSSLGRLWERASKSALSLPPPDPRGVHETFRPIGHGRGALIPVFPASPPRSQTSSLLNSRARRIAH